VVLILGGAGAVIAQDVENPDVSPRTGTFEIEAEGVRAGLMAQVIERLGLEPNAAYFRQHAERPQDLIPLSPDHRSMTWNVWVPEGYNADRPAGVMVYVDAGGGKRPQQGWLPVLEQRNLIFISPRNAGNSVPTHNRMIAALASIDALRAEYELDPRRMYISGGSGGGRVSTHVIFHFPDVFTGAFPIVGANHFRSPTRAGRPVPLLHWINHDRVRQAKQRSRFVYFTGEDDSNRDQVVAVGEDMIAEGFAAELIVAPDHGHSDPGPEDFARGLDFLDQPLRLEGARVYQQGLRLFESGRMSQAYEPLMMAWRYGPAEQAADAAARLEQVRQARDEAVSHVRSVIEAGDRSAAVRAVMQLRRDWRDLLDEELVDELTRAARAGGNP
jgi:hypothetical protein